MYLDIDQRWSLHILENATPNPRLPLGCEAGGDVWNPEGLLTTYYIDATGEAIRAGTLENVFNGSGEVGAGQCSRSDYSYCKPAGEIKLSGPHSIIGRSISLDW